MKRSFAIEYFDVVLFMKQKSKEERKTKKETRKGTKRKQKRKTIRKEERKEQERERERERDRERDSEKGGGKTRLRRNNGRHSELNKNLPFFRGKQVFSMKSKQRNKKKQKQKSKKTKKESLGPSEVVLWAKKIPKKSLSILSQILFFWRVSKISLFDNLAPQ